MSEIKLILGDCLVELKNLPDNSIDACITDPPYELGFMGKAWDSTGVAYRIDLWKEVLRVLKHGGHLLSFGGSRTYHRMACAIEDSGFEIRDQIMWIYGSGFPKSLNIGKAIDKTQGNEREVIGKKGGTYADIKRDKETGQDGLHGGIARERPRVEVYDTKGTSEWEGWGTALKPAHEPIVLARKPLSEKTIVENVLKWGVGGLAIDNCRIKTDDDLAKNYKSVRKSDDVMGERVGKFGFRQGKDSECEATESTALGRFPANIIHDGSDEVIDLFPNTISKWGKQGKSKGSPLFGWDKQNAIDTEKFIGNFGSASRFFYCAKANKSERDKGLSEMEESITGIKNASGRSYKTKCRNCEKEIRYDGREGRCMCKNPDEYYPDVKGKNNHPTVKPLALMKYLITLVTREGQVVLDPFMGSGTTGMACKELRRNFIGIEMNKDYHEIAQKRIGSIIEPLL